MNKIYGIDYRSLTLFRQVIALIYIFLIFVVRIMYFDYYSVESGPFSTFAMSTIQNAPLLTNLITTDIGMILYQVVGVAFGVLLFFGVLPSLSSFVSMGMLILYSRRFFPYYYGTDEVVICILFVLGFVYLINPKKTSVNNYLCVKSNPFILLLLVQITIIYWFNGLNKTHTYWWSGEAVRMALFNAQFNKPLGIYFFQYEWLNRFLTYFSLFFELTIPLFIFSSYKPKTMRFIAGLFILSFHWGINLFADVTLYKFTGTAFFILFLPSNFWDKFPFLSKLLMDFNRTIKLKVKFQYFKKLALLLVFLLFFKAITISLYRQNQRYKFIENVSLERLLKLTTSVTYSPLRQYWFMFAPSPPTISGYIGFDYVKEGKVENVNVYGNQMPNKKFAYYHPFHLCMIIEYIRVEKGIVSKDNEFILLNLFSFEVKRNRIKHIDRKEEDYQLVLYKQSYEDFKKRKKYNFERIVLASYD